MTIFLSGNKDEFQRYSLTLDSGCVEVTTTYELYDVANNNEKEVVVIVGPSVDFQVAQDIAEHFRFNRPNLGVILLRTRLDVGVMARALRSGIREVIASDDASALVNAVNNITNLSKKFLEVNQLNNARSEKGRVIIVFSAKGGSGKTTVSVNLAHALAVQSDLKVALIDLDLQFGDVKVALQVDANRTISDAISMQNTLDMAGVSSLMVGQTENLDLLLAPDNPTDVEFISGQLIEKLLDNLRQIYDFIVVDTPPAFTDPLLKVFDQADKCYLITTLDMPSLKNMKVVIDTLDALNFNRSRLSFVLNRSDVNTGISQTEAENLMGIEFSTVIQNSDEVSISTNSGQPVVIRRPKNPVSRSILDLAKRIIHEYHPELKTEDKSLLKWRRS